MACGKCLFSVYDIYYLLFQKVTGEERTNPLMTFSPGNCQDKSQQPPVTTKMCGLDQMKVVLKEACLPDFIKPQE